MNDAQNANPTPAPATGSSLHELQAEVSGLNSLLLAVVISGLLVCGGLILYLRFQSNVIQADLALLRQNSVQMFESDAKEKPKVKQFVRDLQAFARIHPDFSPIFSKYAPVLTQLQLLESQGAQQSSPAPTPGAQSPISNK